MKQILYIRSKLNKSLFVLSLLSLSLPNLFSQTLSIEECYEKSRLNYPLVKQLNLIDQSQKASLNILNNNYLPQVSATAKASYQSDVTRLPITLPGISIPELAKDQYQVNLEVLQTLWDGGITKAQKKTVISSNEIDKQKIEVELYPLKDRINQLFFGIMLLKQQLQLNRILQKELQENLLKINSLMKSGLANQSDMNLIKIEQVNAIQQEITLKSNLQSNIDILSMFINEKLSEDLELTPPENKLKTEREITIKRPEIELFKTQKASLDNQSELILASSMPRIGLFLQSGLGRPALNMLNDEFSTYYIGGIKVSWNLYNLYSQKDNLKKLNINKQSIDIQEESFLTNTQISIKRQQNEIERLKQLIKSDDELIALRATIKEATALKIENGTATVSDLLKDTNAHNMAIQNKLLHEIQLSLAIYQLNNYTN